MNNTGGSYYRYAVPYGGDTAHPFLLCASPFANLSTEAVGYTPAMLKRYYGMTDVPLTGKGVTIGIISAFSPATLFDDTLAFCEAYSLTVPSLTVAETGTPSDDIPAEWRMEAAIDAEWVHVFAPDALLRFYSSGSAELPELFSLLPEAASECDLLLISFGKAEFAGETEYEKLFSSLPALCICASGDCSRPVYPASSPFVLAVGGTSAYMTKAGLPLGTQAVWKSSGCGISRYLDASPWQEAMAEAKALSGGKRITPDVCHFAYGEYGASVCFTDANGRLVWTNAGGTSLAAPIVAGLTACLYEKGRVLRKELPAVLYSLAGGDAYRLYNRYFFDVTTGISGTYAASLGFDIASGLGVPQFGEILRYALS